MSVRNLPAVSSDVHIDRIITIESSGIAVAYAASWPWEQLPRRLCPQKSLLTKGEQYTAKDYSYTKEEEYTATICKDYLHARICCHRRLSGQRCRRCRPMVIAAQAGCTVEGIGIVVERHSRPDGKPLKSWVPRRILSQNCPF